MEQDTSSVGRHFIRKPDLRLEGEDIETALLSREPREDNKENTKPEEEEAKEKVKKKKKVTMLTDKL